MKQKLPTQIKLHLQQIPAFKRMVDINGQEFTQMTRLFIIAIAMNSEEV